MRVGVGYSYKLIEVFVILEYLSFIKINSTNKRLIFALLLMRMTRKSQVY